MPALRNEIEFTLWQLVPQQRTKDVFYSFNFTGRLPVQNQIIQETTKKIDNTVEKILMFEDSRFKSLNPQMPHLEDAIQDDTSEEFQNHTDVGASAPWDNLPYGRKMRSQDAFMRRKHKSLMRRAEQQEQHH